MKNKIELWNILLTFTHWSYDLPFYVKAFLSEDFKKNNYRLLKNFSDYATRYLWDNIFLDNKIICDYSRTIWDPNRDLDNPDLFKKTDFNNIEVWKKQLPNFLKKYLLKKYYNKYHSNIEKKIFEMKEKYDQIIHIDVHDTWNFLLESELWKYKLREPKFPEVNLFNPENKACNSEIFEKIIDAFKNNFDYHINIDDSKWTWGFVSRKYWKIFWVNSVRLELWRYLYLNEDNQTINDNITKIRKQFEDTLLELKNTIEK